MDLTDRVRSGCREIAERAHSVAIDSERLAMLEAEAVAIEPAPLDPERHYLEGTREDVASYLLALDSINFGSGWSPTLRKRPGCSGYYTVAWALADRWRSPGPWSAAELAALDGPEVAAVLGQEPDHELMALYARALRELAAFLGDRGALELVEDARGSALQLASMCASGMPMFDDVGFWKRAQIVPNDLALAGVASFGDLDRLTIFADNLVPHVLRMDGVLRYSEALAARIDAGKLLPAGSPEEREIRACAVHACELISAGSGVPARTLDTWLWNRGQAPAYKAVARHRTRTVYY